MWVKIFSTQQEAFSGLQVDQPQLVIIGKHRIALVLHSQQLYAVQDFCTHNKESLSKGTVNYLGEIICPWHNYQFQLKSGRECNQRSADLHVYPVEVRDDGVFIDIPEE